MEGCHPPPLPFSRFLGITCCYFSCCFLPVSLLCCNSISSWNDTLPSLPLKKKVFSWANKREYKYLLLHWTPWLRNNNNGLLKRKKKAKSLPKVRQIKNRRKNRVRQKCAKEKKKKKKFGKFYRYQDSEKEDDNCTSLEKLPEPPNDFYWSS